MTTKSEPWYAVKCIFQANNKTSFEERILLVRAASFEDAELKARAEASDYLSNLPGVKLIGCVDIFHIFGNDISDCTEVYSIFYDSSLAPKKYIDKFYNR